MLFRSSSKNYGIPFTFTQEEFNKFKLTTIKNVMQSGKNIGYLAITENANDIKAAIDERKTFIIRTAIAVGIVILIFSFVLNRYFLKPIKNLVTYTKTIKNKNVKGANIDTLKLRNDELGLLSNSLDDMTLELQKRITHAENFSTDLVHHITGGEYAWYQPIESDLYLFPPFLDHTVEPSLSDQPRVMISFDLRFDV